MEEICQPCAALGYFPVGSKAVEKTPVARAGERGCVEIRGACQNNLKGIDLDLALGKRANS
ncbi:MAG: hypothetical protein DMF03_06200 [Verrucomicrobia bacterium]|nr:MAG: hypothetical protein DMF03_06200 [Verrucomicrobiota bacterium]